MQDFLGKPVNIDDYVFGGIGYGNAVWKVLKSRSTLSKPNLALAKLADDSGFGCGVDINLSDFILLSTEDLTLYFLRK